METALLAAVASPRRREILRLLWTTELTAGAIHDAMPDVTFGAVSLQLKVLADAGLVEARSGAARLHVRLRERQPDSSRRLARHDSARPAPRRHAAAAHPRVLRCRGAGPSRAGLALPAVALRERDRQPRQPDGGRHGGPLVP